MSIYRHYLENANYVPSPNCDLRPANDIEILVIHNISLPPGRFGGHHIHDFFQNRLKISADPFFKKIASLKVSAHLLIDRYGNITQFVAFNLRAWHAGVSCWQGRKNCNDFSIGIELEGDDNINYTDAQYQKLIQITQQLMIYYPITLENIVGHEHIAPNRKTDPGPLFDWNFYKQQLKKLI